MLSDDTLRSLETEFCGCSLLPALSSQTHLFIVNLEKKNISNMWVCVTAGLGCGVVQAFGILGYYAA
jgi:hypothetical protein